MSSHYLMQCWHWSIAFLGRHVCKILIEINIFLPRKCIWTHRLQSGGHFISASNMLTDCGYASKIGSSIWRHRSGSTLAQVIPAGTGLLADGTKPLPEAMLTYHEYGPLTIHVKALSEEDLKIPIRKTMFKLRVEYHIQIPQRSMS